MTHEISTSEIVKMAIDGMTVRQISDKTAMPCNTIRKRLNRQGVVAKRFSARSARDMVQDMKAIDAVEFLLQIIETNDMSYEDHHAVDDLGFHMTPAHRRLMICLYDTAPYPASKQTIYDAIYFDNPNPDHSPGSKIIDVFICKLRAAMPENVGHIETLWGRGYRFVPAEKSE